MSDMGISVTGNRVVVRTTRLVAQFEGGRLVQLEDLLANRTLITGGMVDSPIELVFRDGSTAKTASGPAAAVDCRMAGSEAAVIHFQGWDCDALLRISICPDSGSLRVEPSAWSSRPGVLACRWTLGGLHASTTLVAPVCQGIRLPLGDSLIENACWTWPQNWEAALAILEHPEGGGLWIHARDPQMQYKALRVLSPTALGLETHLNGPLERQLACGGLCWHVDVFRGDWREPTDLYRQWLWDTHRLDRRKTERAPWLRELALAIGWCGTDLRLLDAVKRYVDPSRVLIHLSDWRTSEYDENYPDFSPRPDAIEFAKVAAQMGFHVMPHCNAIDVDPTNPDFESLRDFAMRDLGNQRRLGWAWSGGRGLGVPNANLPLMHNRDKKVMVKIHPGLSWWRSLLAERVAEAVRILGVRQVFLDVTLCCGNVYDALVEGLTPAQGMRRLIDEVAGACAGAAIGGEGLNEVIAPGLSIAQVHLFRSVGTTIDGLERTCGAAVNRRLFDGLTRTFGYSGLAAKSAEQVLRGKVHIALGALPTICHLSAEELLNPTESLQQFLTETIGRD